MGKHTRSQISDRVDTISLGAHSRHGAQRVNLPEPGVEVVPTAQNGLAHQPFVLRSQFAIRRI
jgi:hypothetical protein